MQIQQEQSETLWIDRDNRVISFRESEGFEKMTFSTHDELFRYAVEKGAEGYAIQ